MVAVEKAVHSQERSNSQMEKDTQILQSPPASYSKQGFKKVGKTLKMNVHIILVMGDALPNLRQMVCVCTTSAKYPYVTAWK